MLFLCFEFFLNENGTIGLHLVVGHKRLKPLTPFNSLQNSVATGSLGIISISNYYYIKIERERERESLIIIIIVVTSTYCLGGILKGTKLQIQEQKQILSSWSN